MNTTPTILASDSGKHNGEDPPEDVGSARTHRPMAEHVDRGSISRALG